MKKKQDSKYILLIKSLLLALPFIALIGLYIVKDPFMILREYDDYDHPEVRYPHFGYMTWMKYKKYDAIKHYDSFIIGASCSAAFQSYEWKKYIKGTPFRLLGSNENLYETAAKINKLIDEKGSKIKNILLVTDKTLLAVSTPESGLMHIYPQELSGKSMFEINKEFIKGYFTPEFLKPYLTYITTNKCKKYEDQRINGGFLLWDKYTNDDIRVRDKEKEIKAFGLEKFYEKCKDNFVNLPNKHQEEGAPVFSNVHIGIMKSLKNRIDSCHISLKIAMGPQLDGGYINSKDEQILYDIFGKKNVVVYNKKEYKYLETKYNFYDWIHYRLPIANRILRDLYAN